MITGADVYRRLMDLEMLLQSPGDMIRLHSFLCSITPDLDALKKLDQEIEKLHDELQKIIQTTHNYIPKDPP